MSKRKDLVPVWFLSPEWGISLDSYNWKLLSAVKSKKVTNKVRWKTVNYFPTLEMLLTTLHQKIMLHSAPQSTLEDHITECTKQIKDCQEALQKEMTKFNISYKTKPHIYMKWAKFPVEEQDARRKD